MTAFTMFEELHSAVRSIGVNIVAHSNKLLQQLASEGILVEDEKSLIRTPSGLYNMLPDGRVVKIILHITQKALFTKEIPEIEECHRYHLFNCQTLEMMQSIGRSDRYRMASRGDGLFRYTITRKQRAVKEYSGDQGAALSFCRNCLAIYNTRFNRQGNRHFDLRRFIESNELHGDTTVRRIDLDDVPNVYADDWAEISRRRKEVQNYLCEDCMIDLSSPELRRFLHAHHIDGQKNNNVLANIRVLCISCHSKQPNHAHIRNDRSYGQFRQTAAFISHQQDRGFVLDPD
jgi:5-methylcytosine-specific restriction endonuclease McrA